MRIKFLLTPSMLINGLPDPTPRAGETAEIDDKLALDLIRRNIAVPVAEKKRKIKTVAEKPAIGKTVEPPKEGIE